MYFYIYCDIYTYKKRMKLIITSNNVLILLNEKGMKMNEDLNYKR